jgi:hypothetical protein
VTVLVQEFDPTERDTLVRAAILAPSMHNTQPWRFRFRRRSVEVHRDPRRELGAEDPDGRMTLIGVGAAVLNLRVAAASLGAHTMTLLMPDRQRPTLAAQVSVGPHTRDGSCLGALYPFLSRRRTDGQPTTHVDIPAEVREELRRAAASEGVRLEWIDDRDRVRWLRELATDAGIAGADDPRQLVERQVWVSSRRTSEGVPSTTLGLRAGSPPGPVRALGVDPGDRLRDTTCPEAKPCLAVLSTSRDTPHDWLVTGQALQRLLLAATTHGVAVSLLNQPSEHADLRWLVWDPESGWTEPQVVLRFGYGPELPPTPLRPVEEFVLDDHADDPTLPPGW